MYKIKEMSENKEGKKELIQYSGYCIINLIANKIEPDFIPIEESNLVDSTFSEYDFSYRDNRQNNDYYIEAAHNYLSGRKR